MKLLSGGWDGAVPLWDVQSGDRLASVNPGYGRVMSIALSPNADLALASYLDGPDQPVILWDLKESREIDRFSILGNPWHANRQFHVVSCDFSPDGSEALFGTIFGTLIRWDVPAWSEIAIARIFTDELVCARFTPVEDVTVAVGSDEPDESVHLRSWKLSGKDTVPE